MPTVATSQFINKSETTPETDLPRLSAAAQHKMKDAVKQK